MVATAYAFQNFSEDMARAYGRNLDISTKAAINVCTALRGKDAQTAIAYLGRVMAEKQAVPFKRFTDGVGHRKGKMASGRYPFKASKAIKELIESAVANAANKGLAEDLKIVHLCAHKAATPFHQGRQRRRAMKRTHIEVVLQEKELQKKSSTQKTKQITKSVEKNVKAPTVKKEAKPVTKDEPITKVAVEEKPVVKSNTTKKPFKAEEKKE